MRNTRPNDRSPHVLPTAMTLSPQTSPSMSATSNRYLNQISCPARHPRPSSRTAPIQGILRGEQGQHRARQRPTGDLPHLPGCDPLQEDQEEAALRHDRRNKRHRRRGGLSPANPHRRIQGNSSQPCAPTAALPHAAGKGAEVDRLLPRMGGRILQRRHRGH